MKRTDGQSHDEQETDDEQQPDVGLSTQAVPGDNVTSEVEMENGESKSGDFSIGQGGVVLGPNSGTATIGTGTIANQASNNRKGGYATTNGSAFIARGSGSLSFDGTSINSDPNILVFNIWSNASINATDVTLSGSTNESNDTPFLMVGGYPNGAAGTLVFSGESTITSAKGSVIGGSANSVINVVSGTLTVRDSDIKLLDGVRFVVASEAKLVVENSSLEGDGARPSIVVESGGTCEIENSTLTQVWINNEGTTTVTGSSERQSELVNCVIKTRANSVLSISEAKLYDSVRSSNETMIHTEGDGATIRIADSEIYNNQNTLNNSEQASIISVSNADLTLSGVNAHDNTVVKAGGVLYASGGTVTIDDDSTFQKNGLDGGSDEGLAATGGAIMLTNECEATIGRASFEGNGCVERYTKNRFDGGAIYSNNSTLVLNGTEFRENLVWGLYSGSGGAMYFRGGTLTVNGAKFIDNYASTYGGAIGCNGFLRIGTGTEIKIVKVWEDDHNNDGMRPALTDDFAKNIKIYRNGEELGEDVRAKLNYYVMDLKDNEYELADNIAEVREDQEDYSNKDAWLIIVSGLPRGDDNTYTVGEESIPGYRLTTSRGSMHTYFELTNAHDPEKVDLGVHKTWADKNDAYGKRPNEVTVHLLANGTRVSGASVKLNNDNAWTASFADLPKYSGGNEIVYTVAEDAVDGYTATYEQKGGALEITNTYQEEPVVPTTIDIAVSKVWSDSDDANRVRPKSVTVKLYANGADTKETLTLSEDNNWRGSFAGLPQTVDGKMVAYTVGEAGVAHYTASVKGTPATGFTVTNTYRRPSSSSSGNTSTRSYTNTPSTRATTSMPTPKTADASDAVAWMATFALALGAALGLAGIAAKRA